MANATCESFLCCIASNTANALWPANAAKHISATLIARSTFRRPADGRDMFWLHSPAALFLTSIQMCEVSGPSVTFTSKNTLLKAKIQTCAFIQSSYVMTQTVNEITQIQNGFYNSYQPKTGCFSQNSLKHLFRTHLG